METAPCLVKIQGTATAHATIDTSSCIKNGCFNYEAGVYKPLKGMKNHYG